MRLFSGSGKEEFFWQDGCGQDNLYLPVIPFAFCSSKSNSRSNSHSGIQGKEAVSFLGKGFVSLSRFGWPESWTIILTLRESSRAAHNMSSWQSKRSGTLPGQVYRARSLIFCLRQQQKQRLFRASTWAFSAASLLASTSVEQEFRGHLPSVSVQCPFMGLVPMQAHKPFLNLPTLPVPTPPVAASSTNSWLQCEGYCLHFQLIFY